MQRSPFIVTLSSNEDESANSFALSRYIWHTLMITSTTSFVASFCAVERCIATLVIVCRIALMSSKCGVDRLHDVIRKHNKICPFAFTKYLQHSFELFVVRSRVCTASFSSDIKRLFSTIWRALIVDLRSGDADRMNTFESESSCDDTWSLNILSDFVGLAAFRDLNMLRLDLVCTPMLWMSSSFFSEDAMDLCSSGLSSQLLGPNNFTSVCVKWVLLDWTWFGPLRRMPRWDDEAFARMLANGGVARGDLVVWSAFSDEYLNVWGL